MIADAAVTGDRRLTLEAMRDKLARDMDDAPPAVVAQIAGRLAAILAELDALPKSEVVSPFDELARRREDRLATAEDQPASRRQVRERGKRSG
jgi:hypothetical protein